MRSIVVGVLGCLILAGCGSGQVSPKDEKEIGSIMSKGLGAPGGAPGSSPAGGPPKGAGQMKHGIPSGQAPNQPAGN